MRKKVLAGVLATVMTFSMAACGDTGVASNSSAKSGDDSSENGGDPYTVTLVLQGSTQPDEERIEKKINEILEPELNANLDIVVLPWASATQQLQLMLSGDEKIDLFYTNATNAIQYMHSGQIIDMSELIDQYGTNMKSIYGEDIVKTNNVDGFVYGLPNQIERGSIPAVFMRKDLVEKYNINTDDIKEPKDMEKVFEIVQNGEPDMTMLYSTSEGDTPLGRLFRGDGLGDASFGVIMDQTNSTKVENYFATDWFKDTATMLHDWYKRDISVRMLEQTRKIGERYVKQEIYFRFFSHIIREPLLSLKALPVMNLKLCRFMMNLLLIHLLMTELFFR